MQIIGKLMTELRDAKVQAVAAGVESASQSKAVFEQATARITGALVDNVTAISVLDSNLSSSLESAVQRLIHAI